MCVCMCDVCVEVILFPAAVCDEERLTGDDLLTNFRASMSGRLLWSLNNSRELWRLLCVFE